MTERTSFEAEHVERIKLQPRQAGLLRKLMTPEMAHRAARTPSFTVLDGDEVLMCGGAFVQWPGRAGCWALLAESIGHRMTACVRITRRFLDEQPARRFELDVVRDHEEGHRFARLLGFSPETDHMRCYYPDGSAATMYTRIAECLQ